MHKLISIGALAVLGLLASNVAADNPPSPTSINIIQLNCLAPSWADPIYYPGVPVADLDRGSRATLERAFFISQAPTADAFTMQELNDPEFGFFYCGCDTACIAAYVSPQVDPVRISLGFPPVGPARACSISAAPPQTGLYHQGFTCFMSHHDPTYWTARWTTPQTPWEPNGNGACVKTSTITPLAFSDVPLTSDGNHAVYMTGALSTNPSQPVRLWSIHLDSDHDYNRQAELGALLSQFALVNGAIDFIAGDFNTDTGSSNIADEVRTASFIDISEYLGTESLTHPYTDKFYHRAENEQILAHVLVRGATPSIGQVLDLGAMALYPEAQYTNNDVPRIIYDLTHLGSDRFALQGAATK
jgi:hypothetical protein